MGAAAPTSPLLSLKHRRAFLCFDHPGSAKLDSTLHKVISDQERGRDQCISRSDVTDLHADLDLQCSHMR
jgi:hypothetical protein